MRVDAQTLRPDPAAGQRPVRVRARIHQPVPVRWAAAEVTTLVAGLHGHRGTDSDPGAGDLPLRQDPEQHHQLLMPGQARVDRPTQLRHPQRHPEMLEQRRHHRELIAIERALTRANDHRIKAAARIRQRRNKPGRLRATRPRQHPAVPDIEELDHNPAMPRCDRLGAQQLPRPRRPRILMILRRHPAIEREPQPRPPPLPQPGLAVCASPPRQHTTPANPVVHPHGHVAWHCHRRGPPNTPASRAYSSLTTHQVRQVSFTEVLGSGSAPCLAGHILPTPVAGDEQ